MKNLKDLLIASLCIFIGALLIYVVYLQNQVRTLSEQNARQAHTIEQLLRQLP